MKEDPQSNWSIKYGYDRQQRPKALTVRLGPMYWRADRSGKRAQLQRAVRVWLNELHEQAEQK